MKKSIWVSVVVLFIWNLYLTIKLNSGVGSGKGQKMDMIEPITVTNKVIDYKSNITNVVNNVQAKIVNVSLFSADGKKIRSTNGFVYADGEEGCEIISNYRSLADGDKLFVQFDNGIELEAEVVGYDELTDIILLKTYPDFKVAPITFADGKVVDAGEFAVVASARRSDNAERTVSYGVVSAQLQLNRVSLDNQDKWITSAFESDISLNQTNIGAPLLNLHGEVIGMLSQSLTNTATATGMSYAVAGIDIQNIVRLIKQNGVVTRGYLGVITRDMEKIENYEKNALGISLAYLHGALCTAIISDSPAKDAGLLSGDIILRIDETKITNHKDLITALYSYHTGDEVEVGIIRENQEKSIKVVLK